MAVKVGELYALLRLDKQQWDKALKDAERSLDQFQKRAESIVKIGENLTKWITTPLLGIAAASVKMASDAEQSAGKFNVAFGSMADQARETLTQLAADMQRSRFEMQAMAADAQAILGPMIRSREVAAQLSQALAALTVDLASYTNMADSDVHQRLISGLLGSTQATELLGISLRATTLQLEAERLGIQANIATLDDATQIRLRFIAILRQSIDAQGDAIRSAASFESQMRALRADIHQLSVTLGQELMPYAMAAVRWARDFAAGLKDLTPEAKEALVQFGLMAAAAGPLVFALGKVAQGITLTGRALIALTQFARANPYTLLALAAAGAALSIEQVREKIDDLFESLGLGQPFEAIENLIGAFRELDELMAGLEFDPAGAQEEAMQRLRTLYQETLRTLEEDLRRSWATTEDMAAKSVARISDELRRIRREGELAARARLIELVDPGRGQLTTATAARLWAEKQILALQLEGAEAERVRLRTEQAIITAQLAGADRQRKLLADLLGQHEEQLLVIRQSLRELQAQESTLKAALEISTQRNEMAEQWTQQLAQIRAQIEAETARLEEQVQTVEDLRDALRQVSDTIQELNLELGLTKDRLDALDRIQRTAITPPRASGLVPEPTMTRAEAILARLREQATLLELRVDAGVLSIEDAIRGLIDLRARLIELVTEGGRSLADANEEQLRLYVELRSALERWLESLQQVPSRLEQIRDDMERALGVGMAVEREIARATGADFDPLRYEIDVRLRAIRDMFDVTGELTEEMQELLLVVSALSREAEALALEQAVVTSALDAFGRNLGDIGRLLSRSIRFEAGRGLAGFSLDPTAFLTGAISAGIDMLFRAIGGLNNSGQVLERAAQALEAASESWRRTLSEGQFHEIVSADPSAIIRDLQRVRSEIVAEMQRFEKWGVWPWEREAYEALRRQLRDIDEQIAELETRAGEQITSRIEEVLGVTMRGLQSAVAGAFSAATAEEFAQSVESALEGRVRNAFVTAFLESATMAPLFERLGDRIRHALIDIDISPDEMRGIREVIDEIKLRSEPLYQLLDEMGLLAEATERVNREFARLVNVPAGFKVALTRFQVATPVAVPTFHSGGVMPYDGLANLRRGEVILTPEQVRSGMGSIVVHVNVQGNVYGEVDIERAAKRAVGEALRQQRMAAYGVT